MFQAVDKDHKFDSTQLTQKMIQAPPLYRIRPNDVLAIRVFTNKGEFILDPNGELKFGAPGGLTGLTSSAIGTGNGGAAPTTGFVVQPDGRVRLPLVEYVAAVGLTTLQLDSVLEKKFTLFYKDAFVFSQVTNRRVVVLGGGTNGGRVVPLTNEGMNLLEVLAQANLADSRYNRVRLVRGDLTNPEVEQIDLSTINGLRRASLQMAANDVVYVEANRTTLDTLREVLPLATVLTSLATLVVLLRNLTQ